MTETEYVAVYGGSFNPPHIGHVLAAAYSLTVYPINKVLVVPCFQHPFSKNLTSFSDRFAMCSRAFQHVSGVEISRVEAELGGESRTLRTLEYLQAQHPNWSMRLLVGADILVESSKWHAFDRVVEIAPLLLLGRRGINASNAPKPLLPEASSTEIRSWLHDNDLDKAQELLPSQVFDYILEQGLYGISK